MKNNYYENLLKSLESLFRSWMSHIPLTEKKI